MKKNRRVTKLRDLEIDRVDLVDRGANQYAEIVIAKRDVPEDERQRLADQGKALPGGGFPIANEKDLQNAIRAIGRAKDPEKTKKFIMRRARQLGRMNLIPDEWKRMHAKEGMMRKSLDKLSDEQLKNGIKRGIPGFTAAQLMEEIRRRRKKKRKKPPPAQGQAAETMEKPTISF